MLPTRDSGCKGTNFLSNRQMVGIFSLCEMDFSALAVGFLLVFSYFCVRYD